MKFSILIPVYNVEEYLGGCLNSILGQTYQDFEVILVDDGSTDYSRKICDKYTEDYHDKIRVIHKENQGLVSARRVGIREAKGEFCVFIDSDDYVENNLLETIALYLKKDIEIDILIYSFRYYEKGKKTKRSPIVAEDGSIWYGEKKRELYEKLIFTNEITAIWTKAIRTELLKSDMTDYTQYYGKNMAEDLLQSLYPVTFAGKICYTDKTLYNYRMNDKSISHSYTIEQIAKNNTIHVYKQILNYLELWGMNRKAIHQQLDAKWFNDVMYQFVKCYEGVCGKQEKRKVLSFGWDAMIPGQIEADNPYISHAYFKLYKALKRNAYRELDIYFFKRRVYSLWKKCRRCGGKQ